MRGFAYTLRIMSAVKLNMRGIFILFAIIALVLCWISVRFIMVPWHQTMRFRAGNVNVSSATKLKWWQTTVIYQIYPRSFQDSNGDGTGDLKGIVSRLDYIQYLNVGAVWISPFYKSPMRDFGYDVTDHTQVDPVFGDMLDFQELVKECHSRGIKVIIDFVPNHTSNESAWFMKSRTAKPGNKYRDYYIWNSGVSLSNGTKLPPNNWESHFGGPAWTWDEERGQFYYHSFLSSQPDLNYRNNDVPAEIDEVLDFWLEKGVDGFRVDAITKLFEVEDVRLNNPYRKNKGDFVPNLFKNTENLPEIFEVMKRWKQILKKWEEIHSTEKLLIAETSRISVEDRMLYYKTGSIPFFFDLIRAKKQCGATAKCFHAIISDGIKLSNADRWPNFVIGNHDNKRISDRMGDDYVDVMNLLLLTLPGTPTTYYGEELGMRGGNYTNRKPKDPWAFTSGKLENSRDPQRNPMQWDNSVNAGFSTARDTWLPVTENTNWRTCNVKEQKKSPISHLLIYKSLVQLRTHSAFQNPNMSLLEPVDDVLMYVRQEGDEAFLVVINLGKTHRTLNINVGYATGIVDFTTTRGFTHTDVFLNRVEVKPAEGIVVHLIE